MGMRDQSWIPQKLRDKIQCDLIEHPDEINNEDKMARRLMKESLPYITAGLIDLALNDPDSRVRLTATNEVLNRTMGKAGVGAVEEQSAGATLFEGLMQEAEKILQEANGSPGA